MSREKRIQALSCLCEGSSIRSTARITGLAFNTVLQLVTHAGEAAILYHDQHVRNLSVRRVQCDEIQSFCYTKGNLLWMARKPPSGSGTVWTWTAFDPDSKLLITWAVSNTRQTQVAIRFMRDLRSRIPDRERVQISTDGLESYSLAVEEAFGRRASYGQVIGPNKRAVFGDPDPEHISTTGVERHNLTIRTFMRRFTRKSNGFSKTIRNHHNAMALFSLWYNFCRTHLSLGTTPAVRAGIAEYPQGIGWIADLVEDHLPKPGLRGPYRRRAEGTGASGLISSN